MMLMMFLMIMLIKGVKTWPEKSVFQAIFFVLLDTKCNVQCAMYNVQCATLTLGILTTFFSPHNLASKIVLGGRLSR